MDTDPKHSGGMLGAIGRTLWLEGTLEGLMTKLPDISGHIKGPGKLQSTFKPAMRSWTSIGPSTLKILPLVEMWFKSKGWGRGMILWHGFGTLSGFVLFKVISSKLCPYQPSQAYIIWPIPTSDPHPHNIKLPWGCSSKQLYISSDTVGTPQLDL